jgi:hypothetical protein
MHELQEATVLKGEEVTEDCTEVGKIHILEKTGRRPKQVKKK